MRNLSNRILEALRLRAMTARELSKALSVTLVSMRIALAELTASRCVTTTPCACAGSYRAPPRLYRLASDKGVLLGLVKHGHVDSLAERIGDLLFEHGELAVFMGIDRVARVVLHHEAGYRDALERKVAHLVGLYRRAEDQPFRNSLIAQDLRGRLAELKAQRLGAAA